MEREEERLPQPPAAGAFAQYDFDYTARYQEPPYLFEYKGVGFSPVGGLQALSGQKKNGKSIWASVLMGALLADGREDGTFARRFPGLRCRQSTVEELLRLKGRDRLSILYCDTEQERENTSKVVRRALYLGDAPDYTADPRLHVQWLRLVDTDTEGWRRRREAIYWKISQLHPDIVFIDGIRDIIADFNDLESSAELISQLMGIATRERACVWCTLHMNPRPQADDESKMRGHLGTELGNKVSDTFVMHKKRDAVTGAVTFTAQQQDARGKDVEDMQICLTDDGPRWLGVPRFVSATPDADGSRLAGIDKLLSAFRWTRAGSTYTDILTQCRQKGITSSRAVKNLIDEALQAGILEKLGNKRFFYKAPSARTDTADPDEMPF